MSKKRHEMSDEQWQQVEPLLPPQKPKTGRSNLDHRMVINGIIWILRTGAPWRDLPERYGKWQTVSSRFYRWQKRGIWDRLLAELQQLKDAKGQLDWEVHYVDGSVIRAHQHAAGAKKAALKRRV
jgi:transposase